MGKWANETYTDRFGNEWSVRVRGAASKPRRVSFRCKDFHLIAVEAEDSEDSSDASLAKLKEYFCDAERVLEHEGERWYVGYRTRSGGRGGQNNAGLHTRFRSESGEVRYAKGVLHFRHMPHVSLSKHLENADRVARSSVRQG